MRKRETQKFRLHTLFVLGIGIFLVLFSRLYQIQVIEHKRYLRLKEARYFSREKVDLVRGNIYDRKGEPLALSMDVESVAAFPQRISNPRQLAARVASIVQMSPAAVEERLSRRQKKFVWLKRKISFAQAEKIKELKLTGIELITEEKRFYPGGKLAAAVLGMVGMDNQGLSGIEYYFDQIVDQHPGWVRRRKDSLSRRILPLGEGLPSPKRTSIFLTIDKVIQYITEEELERAYLETKAKTGMVIVQDPPTGEILAMACRPNFDPNIYEGITVKQLRNPAVGDIFEPGSTFKLVTLAACLEEGVVQSKEKFFCENGVWKLPAEWIHDHKPSGWLTVEEIIEESSNIGTAKMAGKLGKYKLYEYARNFGFGNLTGIELGGEATGILRKPNRWTKGSIERIAFGQEVGVTAVQLISAFSAIANGGVLMEPRIIRKVCNEKDEVVQKYPPRVVRPVVSKETAVKVGKILVGVVERGTGKLARVNGFLFAGKTGTAEKINLETRKYYRDKHLASFVGWLPADQPRVTILVVLDEPEGHYYGGQIAAPVFARIAARVMRYLGVPPEVRQVN